MRITCLFVSVAIILVAHFDCSPIAGLPTLPVAAHQEKLIDGVAETLKPLPVVGRLTSDLLNHSSSENVLTTANLTGQAAIIHDDSNLGEVVGSLRRRQVLADLEGLPLLGSLEGTAPVTSGLTSDLVAANDRILAAGHIVNLTTGVEDFPLLVEVKDIGPVTPVLTSSLSSLVEGDPRALLRKRETELGALSGLGTIPSLPGFPSLGSFPALSSFPSVSSLPSFGSLPSMSSLSSGSFPGLNSIPQLGSKLGMAKYSMKPFPGIMSR